MKTVISLLALSFLMLGCASNSPNSEFVRTTNFSSLQTFSYKHTLISGMDFRKSEELLLEELSEATMLNEFSARGFLISEAESDFYIVVKWKKAVSSYPSMFDSIDGPTSGLARREEASYQFGSRLHLTVEVYESSTNELFWRNDLPNIFDAIQLTEERVIASLKRAVQNFPQRVEQDPNLPVIE